MQIRLRSWPSRTYTAKRNKKKKEKKEKPHRNARFSGICILAKPSRTYTAKGNKKKEKNLACFACFAPLKN